MTGCTYALQIGEKLKQRYNVKRLIYVAYIKNSQSIQKSGFMPTLQHAVQSLNPVHYNTITAKMQAFFGKKTDMEVMEDCFG